MEWHGLQLRDHYVGKCNLHGRVDSGVTSARAHIAQAHESAIRAVAWSHSDDWLLSSDQNGMVKYWQSNFNNLNSFQAHEAPVRDLSFAPTDAKFVTASDDATLKIWDFGKGTEVSTLTGHNWDAKSVDWHPTKGLLASGSKDHTVKLWDPRTGKCLTSLRGHKNNVVSKVLFDPIRGNLLASAGFETTARVFDLRMMRDALLLKGHDEDVTTLTWHPIHHSLLTTATKNGCIQHYLLDEPNLPEGTPPTKSPYDSPDPSSAPAQSIYPAHRVRYAHEMSVWSLDWHPLGHILASGSADRVTRFWSRARPGETECFHDRYHLGDAAAKAHGAWTSNKTRHVLRDEEEEGDDDQEALVDQKMPTRQLVPGLPGIAAALKDGTSVGGAQTQPLPIFPGMAMAPPPMQPPHLALPGMPSPPFGLIPPGLDPNKLSQAEIQKLLAGRAPPVLPLGQGQPGFPVPPPGFTFGQNGMPIPPPGFQSLPQTFTPPPGSGGEQGIRRRAPLLSQEESLKEEQKRGNWKNAR